MSPFPPSSTTTAPSPRPEGNLTGWRKEDSWERRARLRNFTNSWEKGPLYAAHARFTSTALEWGPVRKILDGFLGRPGGTGTFCLPSEDVAQRHGKLLGEAPVQHETGTKKWKRLRDAQGDGPEHSFTETQRLWGVQGKQPKVLRPPPEKCSNELRKVLGWGRKRAPVPETSNACPWQGHMWLAVHSDRGQTDWVTSEVPRDYRWRRWPSNRFTPFTNAWMRENCRHAQPPELRSPMRDRDLELAELHVLHRMDMGAQGLNEVRLERNKGISLHTWIFWLWNAYLLTDLDLE